MLYQTPTYAGVPHNHFHTKPHNFALQSFFICIAAPNPMTTATAVGSPLSHGDTNAPALS